MAPGRLQRGCLEGGKSWVFICFYHNVFTFSMHLALWLMDLELGGAHGGPGDGTCHFYGSFTGLLMLAKGRRRDGMKFERRRAWPRGGVGKG